MCYETNKKQAKLLLMREIPQLGNSTCLQIAKIANDIDFMSHPCVQECLVKIWYGKLQPDTGYLRVSYRLKKQIVNQLRVVTISSLIDRSFVCLAVCGAMGLLFPRNSSLFEKRGERRGGENRRRSHPRSLYRKVCDFNLLIET
jgi:hypothetical protein